MSFKELFLGKPIPKNKGDPEKIHVFIDCPNVEMRTKAKGWKIDWRKLHGWLVREYGATKLYAFVPNGDSGMLGAIEHQSALAHFGYKLVTKEPIIRNNCSNKCNMDVEIACEVAFTKAVYHKAIIISGDGDFHDLARRLNNEGKLKAVIFPDSEQLPRNYAKDLKMEDKIVFLDRFGIKDKIKQEQFEQPPLWDEERGEL